MSPLQQVDLISQHSLFIAEQRDENTQTDGGFSYGVGDYEDGEDLATHVLQVL